MHWRLKNEKRKESAKRMECQNQHRTNDEFYKIRQDLLMAISDLRLNGTQWNILWNVFINNYDNGSRECSLSVLESLTGYCRKQIARELKKMFGRNILTEVIKPDYIYARVININQDFTKWKGEH
jgi:hypothetical protein